MCKRLIIAEHNGFKVIQEIHMGLGSISNQRKSGLYMKYGQNGKKESIRSEKLKIVDYSHPNEFLARE